MSGVAELTGRPLRLAFGAAAILSALAFSAPAATAATSVGQRTVLGPQPCSDEATYPWMGDSIARKVQIPSLTRPDGIAQYAGTILRPADTASYPGARPVVVLQHGNNGNQCRLWWAAQDLAGHGYVTLIWTVPSGTNTQNFIRSLDATRSAVAFPGNAANPHLAFSDPSRVGILGSSLGAIVTSYAQGDPNPNVRAAIAFDNLVPGVPAAAGDGLCGNFEQTALDVTPRVPAMGFSKGQPCGDDPSPFAKQPAFELWRGAGVPSMELIMEGFSHTDFMANGSEQQRFDLSHYVRAWFDRWLGGDVAAEDRLLAETINGRAVSEVLSTEFKSGAYLPPRVDTNDLLAWFGRDVVAPETNRGRGPDRKVTRRHLRRRGVVFRFSSSEPGGSFECRLDDKRWKECAPPERLRRSSRGRHDFRARAVDAAGNVDGKPVRWTFRVTR